VPPVKKIQNGKHGNRKVKYNIDDQMTEMRMQGNAFLTV